MWMSEARPLTASVIIFVTRRMIGASAASAAATDASSAPPASAPCVVSSRTVKSIDDSVSLSMLSMNFLILPRAPIAVSISTFIRNRSVSSNSRSIGSWTRIFSRPSSCDSGTTRNFLINSSGINSMLAAAIASSLSRSMYSSPNWLANALATSSSEAWPRSISVWPIFLPEPSATLSASSTWLSLTTPQRTRISPSFLR
jgi:hypothetical protein